MATSCIDNLQHAKSACNTPDGSCRTAQLTDQLPTDDPIAQPCKHAIGCPACQFGRPSPALANLRAELLSPSSRHGRLQKQHATASVSFPMQSYSSLHQQQLRMAQRRFNPQPARSSCSARGPATSSFYPAKTRLPCTCNCHTYSPRRLDTPTSRMATLQPRLDPYSDKPAPTCAPAIPIIPRPQARQRQLHAPTTDYTQKHGPVISPTFCPAPAITYLVHGSLSTAH